MMGEYTLIKTAGAFGALAVILGAFGAHALTPHLDAAQLQNFKTASMYHFIHAVVLIILSFIYVLKRNTVIAWSFGLISLGILFFSGSLYILSTRHLIGGDVWLFLGPVTPVGGIFLILGWLNLWRIGQEMRS